MYSNFRLELFIDAVNKLHDSAYKFTSEMMFLH